MNVIRSGLATLCSVVLVAACAPDAWKDNPAYDRFLDQVQKDCYYQRIGTNNVGDLLNNPGTMQGTSFMDITSRLYAGQITSQSWTESMVAFFEARDSDPGVQCVLKHLPKR
jgi:hypothetical protein